MPSSSPRSGSSIAWRSMPIFRSAIWSTAAEISTDIQSMCAPAASRSAEWIVEDANRASEVIRRIRALAKKTEIEVIPLDINQIVREAVALVRRELATNAVSVRMELASNLPRICGDRIQLQQV